MKYIFVFAIIPIILSGCATTASIDDRLLQAKRVGTLVEVTAQTAVVNTADKYPDTVPFYKAAIAVVDLLLQNKDYSPDSLVAAMQGLKINEIKNDVFRRNASIILKIYQVEVGTRISAKLDQEIYIRPILQGLRDGLADGLKK